MPNSDTGSVFPLAFDTFSTLATYTASNLDAVNAGLQSHAAWMSKVARSVEALETKTGITNSSDSNSLEVRVNSASASLANVSSSLLNYQPLDTQLTAVSRLVPFSNSVPMFTTTATATVTEITSFGQTLIATTGSQSLRTAAGPLGSAALADTSSIVMQATVDAVGDLLVGTGVDTVGRRAVGGNDTILVADNGQGTGIKWVTLTEGMVNPLNKDGLATVPSLRTLGLSNTQSQPGDIQLGALAALVPFANSIPMFTTTATATVTEITAFGQQVIVTTGSQSGRTLFGVGAGSGDMVASNNLSDLVNKTTSRVNLGVEIGVAVQAWDKQLDVVSGLVPFPNSIIVWNTTATATVTQLSTFSQPLLNVTSTLSFKTVGGFNFLQPENNLSDVGATGTARFNLHDQVLATAQFVVTSQVTASGTLSATVTDNYTGTGGDVALLTGQTDFRQNGPWTVVVGGAWTRPTDYPSGGGVRSRLIQVNNGATHFDTIWQLHTNGAVTVDATSTSWVKSRTELASASSVDIADVGNFYTSSSVEGALQELGAGTPITSLPGYVRTLAVNSGTTVVNTSQSSSLWNGSKYDIAANSINVFDTFVTETFGVYINSSTNSTHDLFYTSLFDEVVVGSVGTGIFGTSVGTGSRPFVFRTTVTFLTVGATGSIVTSIEGFMNNPTNFDGPLNLTGIAQQKYGWVQSTNSTIDTTQAITVDMKSSTLPNPLTASQSIVARGHRILKFNAP